MGAYCCCGRKIGYLGYSEKDCVCDHTGWNSNILPEKNGIYLTRVAIDSGDRYEKLQRFCAASKKWQDDRDDECVYEWRNRIL